ncbi:hypothetical protein BKA93DRAFT_443169 [Sparassis latifolia]
MYGGASRLRPRRRGPRHVVWPTSYVLWLPAMAISLPPIGSWSKLLGDFFAVKGRPDGLQLLCTTLNSTICSPSPRTLHPPA